MEESAKIEITYETRIINIGHLPGHVNGKESYGLTTPLITTSSGAKMGKTEKGAVWLDEKQTSPYEYWQFWRNVNDADVFKYLRLFTELPLDEISSFENNKSRNINDFKIFFSCCGTCIELVLFFFV